MTQEDKELLLKDLCARLPYGVKFASFSQSMKNHSEPVTLRQIYYHNECDANNIEGDNDISTIIEFVKPYLRTMSSMTEEENKQRKELSILLWYNSNGERGFDGFGEISGEDVLKAVDWLNVHHFDYRGLIKKGIALEAPEGMYEIQD